MYRDGFIDRNHSPRFSVFLVFSYSRHSRLHQCGVPLQRPRFIPRRWSRRKRAKETTTIYHPTYIYTYVHIMYIPFYYRSFVRCLRVPFVSHYNSARSSTLLCHLGAPERPVLLRSCCSYLSSRPAMTETSHLATASAAVRQYPSSLLLFLSVVKKFSGFRPNLLRDTWTIIFMVSGKHYFINLPIS